MQGTFEGIMTGRTVVARRLASSLVFLAALVLVAACDATVQPSVPASHAPSVAPEEPSLTPVPAGPSGPPADPTEFVPPTPSCPAPDGPVDVPAVSVSIRGGPAIVATRGSASLATCSTVATFDAALPDPETGLVTHDGDRLTLALPRGWQFLHWEGFDRPAVGDAGNIWPPIDTPQRPTTIEVPVPFRPGASIAGYTLTITTDDGRVVGTLEIRLMTTLVSS
jgi:hypothetical protein